MQKLLTLDELKTNLAAQEMIRRMNEEMLPSAKRVADTVQRNCIPDSRTPQQASQPL